MSSYSQDIDLNIFTSNLAYGSSSGGYDYGLVGNRDYRVKCIKMNVDEPTSSFGRIVVEKWDGTCLSIGSLPDASNEKKWNFEKDEQFTRIQLYSDKDRLCGIKISTNRQTLQYFVPSCSMEKHQDIPVGSGKCIGVFGQSGTYVDCLGFAMFKK